MTSPCTANHQGPAQAQSATTKAADWISARRAGVRLPEHLLPEDSIEDHIEAYNYDRSRQI